MNPTTEPLVQCQHVTLSYTNKDVLEDVSFSIQRGEFVYVIGRTGAGKSSLLRLLYADLKPVAGFAKVEAYKIESIKSRQIPYLRRKLGIIFQDFQLLSDRSVGDNIEFALRATGWKNKQKIQNRINDVLMQVGLSSKLNAFPHQLSGGEQQRTAIARALINDPVLLLADEPTGNLDPEVTENIVEILQQINRAGTAVVMATHEHDLLKKHPARVLECREGRVVEKS